MRPESILIWKVNTNAEKNEAPTLAEAYLLPHMVDELIIVKHNVMTESTKKSSRMWLIKFAPFRTSWTDIVRRGTFTLRGVRNAQARNYLAAMRKGDQVFFYHSQQQLAIVGIMEVTREAYPDQTSSDPQWLTCDFQPVLTLSKPVTLSEIREEPTLAKLLLIRQPRLAVMPVTKEESMDIKRLSAK